MRRHSEVPCSRPPIRQGRKVSFLAQLPTDTNGEEDDEKQKKKEEEGKEKPDDERSSTYIRRAYTYVSNKLYEF